MIKLPECPICKKAIVGEVARQSEFLPFCSERCRRVDFFRWFDGKYAIEEPLSPGLLAAELEQSRAELNDSSADDES